MQLHPTAPADFPEGYTQHPTRSLYYKTDGKGKLTEVRNIFGCDLTPDFAPDLQLFLKSRFGLQKRP